MTTAAQLITSTAAQPQQERRPRRYYAIYHPRGIHALSPRDTLYRYDTAADRAEDIDRINRQNENMKLMQAVPRTFAAKRFPRAFSRDVIIWRPWSDGDASFTVPIWRDYEDGTQEYTGHPRNVVFMTYEVREVDAWNSPDGWTYNETYRLGSFTTAAQDEHRAFYRALARMGIRFYRGKVRAVDDGCIIEIIDRKTAEPLFVAIPQEV